MSTKKVALIVESGAKAKKIASFLPDNYIVLASFGHVTDLKKKELADNHQKKTLHLAQKQQQLPTWLVWELQ